MYDDDGFDPTGFFDEIDPGKIARTFTVQLERAIKATPRVELPFYPEINIQHTGLILQAACRAVLPRNERTGIGLPPRPPDQSHLSLLQSAQMNMIDVFSNPRKEATRDQRKTAGAFFHAAATELLAAGYVELGEALDKYIVETPGPFALAKPGVRSNKAKPANQL